MQPDQPGQTTPQSPINAPDYLHLEPVVEKSPKSKKKRIVMGAIVFILLLAIGATVFWIVWQQNSIQWRLDGALDNLLHSPYITRSQTITPPGSGPVLTVHTSTDFTSTTAPKSTINYHFVPAPKTAPHASPDFEAAGDITVLNNKNFYGRLSMVPQDILPKGAALNRWYAVDKPTESTLTNTANDFDYLKLRNQFNTVFGIFPAGNLADDIRAQITADIQANKVYTIESTQAEIVGGKQTTVYTLKVDYEKLSGLNQKLADLLGIDSSSLLFTVNDKPLTAWVDNGTDKVIKLSWTNGDANFKNVATVEESYAYPSSLQINAPADATKLP